MRTWYTRGADPEAELPEGRLIETLRAELHRHSPTESEAAEDNLDSLLKQAAAWTSEAADSFRGLFAQATEESAHTALVRRAALICAPLHLHYGAWLQWLSTPGNADDPAVLEALTLYATDVGAGRARAGRGDAYLSLLRKLGVAENASPASRLTSELRLADAHFRLAAVLLVLSRRPAEFTPELLGADLCLRTVGLLPALAPVREREPNALDWEGLVPSAGRGAVDAQQDQGRCVSGFRWALGELRAWHAVIHEELTAALEPSYEMAELLRIRAREAAVYHSGYPLEGRPLATWLREARTDPYPLLGALSRSRLVRPGKPERSPLLGRLVGADGPMFRVFSPDDLAVIRRWIMTLDRESEPKPPAITQLPALELESPAPAAGQAPPGLRDAYHRLLRRTPSPATLDWARTYVHGWLARARQGPESGAALPEHPEPLRPWLADMHDRHDAEYEAGQGQELPSREALIDATVQQAPLTLIDGSWLMGFTDHAYASSEIGHSLFDTYWDELGNGEAELNHPLIYREVLGEMGVTLPPTASREFAHWEGFREGAFELPVYWLSIGRFPRTFLPEVLGLNLAMELSGVGGSYRRARRALREYGYSTHFVDIHNTIDNVATGHSAWAADAIDTYIATLGAGPEGRAAAWERVRAGYRSLTPPSTWAARRAQRRAMKNARAGIR